MDALELVSVVDRLDNGVCPNCHSKLKYDTIELTTGYLENNGMAKSSETLIEKHVVYCPKCNYSSRAIQIGLKIIPEDRIVKFDPNWDKKYLEENTLVFGEKGKNPFLKKEKE